MTYAKKAPPTPEVIAAMYGTRVAHDPGFTIEHRLVAMYLYCAGYKNYCEVKDSDITQALDLEIERIEEILDDLAMLGYIRRDGYAGRGGNPKVHLQTPYFPTVPKEYWGWGATGGK